VIKFTTLFGVLATGLAIQLSQKAAGLDHHGNPILENGVQVLAPQYETIKYVIAGVSIVISMFFAWRSFYRMRIGTEVKASDFAPKVEPVVVAKVESKPEPKQSTPVPPTVRTEPPVDEKPAAKAAAAAKKELDDNKSDDNKVDDNKVDDNKLDDNKSDDNKVDDKKSDDKKSETKDD